MSSIRRVAADRVLRSPALGLMLAANAVLALATVIGVVALWPSDAKIEQPPSLVRPVTHEAEVVAVALADCRVPGRENCRRVSAVLQSGPERDKRVRFTVGDTPDQTGIDVGDRIRVAKSPLPPDAVVGGVRADQYSFADFERRTPLLWRSLSASSPSSCSPAGGKASARSSGWSRAWRSSSSSSSRRSSTASRRQRSRSSAPWA